MKTFKLGEICQIKYGKDHKKLKRGIYPAYGSGGIIRYVDQFLSDRPSVLIPRKGTLNNLFYVDKPFWTVDTLFWTEINTEKAIPQFVYYYLKSQDLATLNIGTAVPSLTISILNELEIPAFDLEHQHLITKLLSTFDEKVILNNRINDYLAEALQTRFIHWIESENDPWGSMDAATIGSLDLVVTDYVANGSFASLKQNVKLLNDGGYAYFMRNTDFKSGSFNVFVPEHSYRFLSKSALHGGEVIISNVGDVGSVHRCPVLDKPMTLGNNEILVKGTINDQYANDYLYLLFKSRLGQHLIDSVTGGSVQRKFNKTDFKSIEIPLPSKSGLRAFNCWSKPFFETIEANRNEARYLESLRDSLLPRLMSGEIDVSKVVV